MPSDRALEIGCPAESIDNDKMYEELHIYNDDGSSSTQCKECIPNCYRHKKISEYLDPVEQEQLQVPPVVDCPSNVKWGSIGALRPLV